jgi:hypothetical protein
MKRSLPLAGFLLLSFASSVNVLANGDPVPTAAPPPPTHYERFTRAGCVPCVQETFTVKTITISPVKLPPVQMGLSPSAELPSRTGQIVLDVMRASELGRPTRELLAVRITILGGVSTGPSAQMFPLGAGMLDAEDNIDLANAANALAKAAAAAPRDASANSVDTDYRVGSVRVGFMRVQKDVVAYVQVGDIALLSQRPVWQVPTTLFLAPSELPLLATGLSEVTAKIKALRGT